MPRKPIFSVFLSDSEHEKSEITFGDIKQDQLVGVSAVSSLKGCEAYWNIISLLKMGVISTMPDVNFEATSLTRIHFMNQ